MTDRKTALRTVKPGDRPVRAKTLAEAIESGSYLEILLAQRRQLVKDLHDAQGPAKAAMHRQLALLSKEIEMEKLKVLEGGGDGGDDIEDEPYTEASV